MNLDNYLSLLVEVLETRGLGKLQATYYVNRSYVYQYQSTSYFLVVSTYTYMITVPTKYSIRIEYSIRKLSEYWPSKNSFEFESNLTPSNYVLEPVARKHWRRTRSISYEKN